MVEVFGDLFVAEDSVKAAGVAEADLASGGR